MSETLGMPATVHPSELAGQVAFVTGGATGIGLAVVHALAARGAAVAIFNRSRERAEAAVEALRQAGHTAHAYPTDISKTTSVDESIQAALAALGRVDVLINNAGRTRDGGLHAVDAA